MILKRDCIEIKKVANGYIIYPGDSPESRHSASLTSDCYVYESIDGVKSHLDAVMPLGKADYKHNYENPGDETHANET